MPLQLTPSLPCFQKYGMGLHTRSCSNLIQIRNFRWVPLLASNRVCFHGNLCPFPVVFSVPHPPHLNFTRTGCLAMVV